jgi:biopolymer transport protein ExbB/TolQ
MTITILDALYLVLIVFTSVIWTLLVLVLIKVVRIITVVDEITSYYTKIKKVLQSYESIPNNVKEAIKSKFKRNDK